RLRLDDPLGLLGLPPGDHDVLDERPVAEEGGHLHPARQVAALHPQRDARPRAEAEGAGPMSVAISYPWRWEGTVDRRPFAILGIAMSIVKYAIDSLMVNLLCGRTWTPINYWMAGDTFAALLHSDALAPARWPLLITSVPFISP